jgi:DNA-damage-inducible protein D
MKSQEIRDLFAQFESVASEIERIECWSARELQTLLGYSRWENFKKVIQKAKDACDFAGEKVDDHFPEVRKTISMPKGAKKEIDDILLTRYACYLIAQNGDSRKTEVAFAQNYFAVQTRRAEIIEQRLLEYERIKVSEKNTKSQKQLSKILFEHGIDHKGFAIIRSKGDHALFRLPTALLKRKMGIPENRSVDDFLPTISIKAKSLADDMTELNVKNKNLEGQEPIEEEHIENNNAVRKMLVVRGIFPENISAVEDVKKIKRQIVSEDKKVLKEIKKKE